MREKPRPASQALCAGWNRFSVPGMHFTLSASNVHTAASNPRQEHGGEVKDALRRATFKIQTHVNAAERRIIKVVLRFLGKKTAPVGGGVAAAAGRGSCGKRLE